MEASSDLDHATGKLRDILETSNQITVLKVGSFVEFFDGTQGQITSVQISSNVLYQVSYWTASVRHEEWFREFELQPCGPERQAIGFK